ncbi:MAG: cupin domain-containing protein [Gammaproteobacteria bacterium]|jgi:hypothetical protein|nr:cupin domain-containing protein [Gammaproteobacteria bacterium]MBT4606883.1 cupin domain-containing protein [Thiotrichales bacterium]MBT3471918.1 cupin domain-containing protein [Gammaproteobacteria bacterium]MBT3966265.1 cupin domain-containing protein [Gammaproteobacteria bacterium]MBT4080894.1 cupin domain-containing protein [Gammaproteobacteria bacterium]
MSTIQINHKPSQVELDANGVCQWAIWSKEPSTFPWHYECEETCYFTKGRVTVTPEGGEPIEMREGDLVTFPEGMTCSWEIHEAVEKHYRFC